MEGYKHELKIILSLNEDDFDIVTIESVAMRLAALYNNFELLISLSPRIQFEPHTCLSHAVIGKSDNCFNFLLGCCKDTERGIQGVRNAFTVAVAKNRLNYAESMYYVFGANKLDSNHLRVIATTPQMKALIEKL